MGKGTNIVGREGSVASLPNEILLKVGTFCSFEQIGRLRCCSQNFNQLFSHDFSKKITLRKYSKFYASQPPPTVLPLNYWDTVEQHREDINFLELILVAIQSNNYSFLTQLHSRHILPPLLWEILFRIACAKGIRPLVDFTFERKAYYPMELKYSIFLALVARNYRIAWMLCMNTPFALWPPLQLILIGFILSVINFGMELFQKRTTSPKVEISFVQR